MQNREGRVQEKKYLFRLRPQRGASRRRKFPRIGHVHKSGCLSFWSR